MGCGEKEVGIMQENKKENTREGGRRESEGEKNKGEEEERGFAMMYLRSLSIPTEVLFIMLKSNIYAVGEIMGKY